MVPPVTEGAHPCKELPLVVMHIFENLSDPWGQTEEGELAVFNMDAREQGKH